MKTSPPKFVDSIQAADLMAGLGSEFAVVQNPGYVYSPYELYALPPKKTTLDRGMAAAVMDMDGTTTTTETLCIHSLETMVKRVCGRGTDPGWGLDPTQDYPHIIGNSTTKHVEYLIRTYGEAIRPASLRSHYLRAAHWTLRHSPDSGRREEVIANLKAFGLGDSISDLRTWEPGVDGAEPSGWSDLERRLAIEGVNATVRAAIDIYYQRYHEILGLIDAGQGESLSTTFGPGGTDGLIRPMKGIGIFLALIGGNLGEAAGELYDILWQELPAGLRPNVILDPSGLSALGRVFEAQPALVALVTSSIEYEAGVVLREVFRHLEREAGDWPLDTAEGDRIGPLFADPRSFYRATVTASDSSEIRLKPHRDLYAIALHRLGLEPADFDRVVGFEDSESGTIAIRAAGIPLSVALPFHDTAGHHFGAASWVLPGGLPEAILCHRCFMPALF